MEVRESQTPPTTRLSTNHQTTPPASIMAGVAYVPFKATKGLGFKLTPPPES